jgi:hypothetical protein
MEAIANLKRKLAKAPAPLRDFLFIPWELRGPVTPADVVLATQITYRYEFLKALRRMTQDCRRIHADQREALPPGPEKDRAQRHCATLAYGLMSDFSRRPIAGSTDGPYHSVATLLFELLTGRANGDLKRHCDFVRKTRNKSQGTGCPAEEGQPVPEM